MSIDVTGEGVAVAAEVANAAPILNLAAPALGPTLNYEPVPGLPKDLQPDPGDILLGKAFWPWEDLGAKGIPEQWLYMSRKVQGVIAQLTVQTPGGPKLVKAAADGTLLVSPIQLAAQQLHAATRPDAWVDADIVNFPFGLSLAANGESAAVVPSSLFGYQLIHLHYMNESAIANGNVDMWIHESQANICRLSTHVVGSQDVPFYGLGVGALLSITFKNTTAGNARISGILYAADLGLG